MNEIPWALDAIRALGVAGGPVFAILWFLEQRERKAAQTENRGLLREVLTVMSTATHSVSEVTAAVATMGEILRERRKG